MPERFKLDKLCIIKEVEKFLNPSWCVVVPSQPSEGIKQTLIC